MDAHVFAVLTSLVNASYAYVSLSFCLVHITFVHIVPLLRARVCAYVLLVWECSGICLTMNNPGPLSSCVLVYNHTL